MSERSSIEYVMAGLDPATQGHALRRRPWMAGSGAGHDGDFCAS